jgi:nicotinamide-nucleotide amidase
MLLELLRAAPPLTLAVAESFTGGRVQAELTAVAGASAFFLGGITAYALHEKVRHLGVDAALAAQTDGVAPEVARQMARGACALFGADLALATTGYAEPVPARGVSFPHGYWALCHRRRDLTDHWREGRVEARGRSRTEVQELAAAAAVAGLLDYLREWRVAGSP